MAVARTENVDHRQHFGAVHEDIFLEPTPPQSIVHDLYAQSNIPRAITMTLIKIDYHGWGRERARGGYSCYAWP